MAVPLHAGKAGEIERDAAPHRRRLPGKRGGREQQIEENRRGGDGLQHQPPADRPDAGDERRIRRDSARIAGHDDQRNRDRAVLPEAPDRLVDERQIDRTRPEAGQRAAEIKPRSVRQREKQRPEAEQQRPRQHDPPAAVPVHEEPDHKLVQRVNVHETRPQRRDAGG